MRINNPATKKSETGGLVRLNPHSVDPELLEGIVHADLGLRIGDDRFQLHPGSTGGAVGGFDHLGHAGHRVERDAHIRPFRHDRGVNDEFKISKSDIPAITGLGVGRKVPGFAGRQSDRPQSRVPERNGEGP